MISTTLNFDSPEAAKAFLTFVDRSKHGTGTPAPLINGLAASAVRSAEVIVRGSDGNIISSSPKTNDY